MWIGVAEAYGVETLMVRFAAGQRFDVSDMRSIGRDRRLREPARAGDFGQCGLDRGYRLLRKGRSRRQVATRKNPVFTFEAFL